ncbi:hypothetical protein PUN28_002861 [Cardiocondyla obscurior]|uniref:Secreted protein n=1 Tax=Cardiocondyla obscurior TaxID=286306 RepID=A0AAW2GWD3_9HYME
MSSLCCESVGGMSLRELVNTVVLIAIYVSLQSSSVRRDKGSCAAGGRFCVLNRFKREPCHHHSRQKTPWLHHALRWGKHRSVNLITLLTSIRENLKRRSH